MNWFCVALRLSSLCCRLFTFLGREGPGLLLDVDAIELKLKNLTGRAVLDAFRFCVSPLFCVVLFPALTAAFVVIAVIKDVIVVVAFLLLFLLLLYLVLFPTFLSSFSLPPPPPPAYPHSHCLVRALVLYNCRSPLPILELLPLLTAPGFTRE